MEYPPGTCQCGCGKSTSIIRKSNTACGLVRGQYRRYLVGHNKLQHGGARKGDHIPEYAVWTSMKQRCNDPNLISYKNYGGRGITVCDRWLDFGNFMEDMGPRPTLRHTIERLDNNRGYSPDNCVWMLYAEQARNKRTVKLNAEAVKAIRYMLAKGVKQGMLAGLYGVSQATVSLIKRGKNWSSVE